MSERVFEWDGGSIVQHSDKQAYEICNRQGLYRGTIWTGGDGAGPWQIYEACALTAADFRAIAEFMEGLEA